MRGAGWLVALSLVAVFDPPAGAQAVRSEWLPCEPWLASIRSYTDACETVVQGEPDSELSVLKEIEAARDVDDADATKRLVASITAKRGAIEAIEPPPDLAALHVRLVAYFGAIERAGAAIGYDGAGLRATVVRDCYAALLALYRELYGMLAERGCNSGDVDALRETTIPGLEVALARDDWEGARAPSGRK